MLWIITYVTWKVGRHGSTNSLKQLSSLLITLGSIRCLLLLKRISKTSLFSLTFGLTAASIVYTYYLILNTLSKSLLAKTRLFSWVATVQSLKMKRVQRKYETLFSSMKSSTQLLTTTRWWFGKVLNGTLGLVLLFYLQKVFRFSCFRAKAIGRFSTYFCRLHMIFITISWITSK